MRWRTIAFPQAPLEKYLSLYCELKISKSELQQAIGEDLHNVECKKAYCIKRSDVVNAIQLYKNGAISKDALVEWVNVVWFTELYVFDDEDADSIIKFKYGIRAIKYNYIKTKSRRRKLSAFWHARRDSNARPFA